MAPKIDAKIAYQHDRQHSMYDVQVVRLTVDNMCFDMPVDSESQAGRIVARLKSIFDDKMTSRIRWSTNLEAELDARFVPDCDPYLEGARAMFGRQDVTKDERDKFKYVFIRAFNLLGPRLVVNTFEFVDLMVNELKTRGIFDAVNRSVSDKMMANEKESSK